MPSVIREHWWSITHGAAGTSGAAGTHRTSRAHGTLGTN